MSDTDLGFWVMTLFRLNLNKAKIWVVHLGSNDLSQECVFVKNRRMKPKKKKKDQQPSAPPPPKKPDPSFPDEAQREEDRGDFGGFPDRDLKKNLGGCG